MALPKIESGREEELLGAEPETPVPDHPNYEAVFLAWVTWTAKASMLRFRGLRDSVEIQSFHSAAQMLLQADGADRLRAFIDFAFEPGTGEHRAAMDWIEGEPPWRNVGNGLEH